MNTKIVTAKISVNEMTGYRRYPDIVNQLNEWCVDNIGPKGLSWKLHYNYNHLVVAYEFLTEEDAMMFRLVFASELRKR